MGGGVGFFYKEDWSAAGARGALAEFTYKGGGVAVTAVEWACVNSAKLYAVKTDCVCVGFGDCFSV